MCFGAYPAVGALLLGRLAEAVVAVVEAPPHVARPCGREVLVARLVAARLAIGEHALHIGQLRRGEHAVELCRLAMGCASRLGPGN